MDPNDVPVSQLSYALLSWLRNPQIHIALTSGEEIHQLRDECDQLRAEMERLRGQLNRAEALYAQECVLNLTLEDQLRALGVKRKR